jgi:hypothetical protein
VRAVERGSDRVLAGFGCVFTSVSGDGPHAYATTPGELLELELALPGARPHLYEVALVDRRVAVAPLRVELAPGERRELVFEYDDPGVVRGRVVDARGAPVADALVFFGAVERLRGDEPFKPYRVDRVADGVRTGADGRYELRGRGHRVTAWKAGHGSASAPRESCARLALSDPGSIRGVVRGPQGAPLAGAAVLLDREQRAVTDPSGRFAIEGVEPGVRGLDLGDRDWIAVGVRPGEETRFELDASTFFPSVALELRGPPAAVARARRAMLLPLADAGPARVAECADGSCDVERLSPGRYQLVLDTGAVAEVQVTGVRERVELGSATLELRGEPGLRVHVVPEGASDLLELLCARVAAQRIGPDGGAVFTGLAHGLWRARGGDELERAVVIDADAQVVDLR